MNKYALLILLNAPLALFGLFNVFLSYKLKRIRRVQVWIRVVFWLTILAGLWFAEPLTNLLYNKNLTDSTPLSIYDVILVTGIIVSLLLVARAYARIAETEKKINELHESIAIRISDNKQARK